MFQLTTIAYTLMHCNALCHSDSRDMWIALYHHLPYSLNHSMASSHGIPAHVFKQLNGFNAREGIVGLCE